MVASNPARLGNQSYFTKISMAKVADSQAKTAYDEFHEGLGTDTRMPTVFRLDLATSSGGALEMYFFDYQTFAWGIWCPAGKCNPDSRFMILDMAHKPQ
jgi:hypothetical protein